MAESKQQYITQTQENGSVMISEDVIATIVGNAAVYLHGSLLPPRPGSGRRRGDGTEASVVEQGNV